MRFVIAVMVFIAGGMMLFMGGFWTTMRDWANWTVGNFTLNPFEETFVLAAMFLAVGLWLAGIYIAIKGKDEGPGGTDV